VAEPVSLVRYHARANCTTALPNREAAWLDHNTKDERVVLPHSLTPLGGKGGGVLFAYSRYWPLYINAVISKIPFVKIPPSFDKGRGSGGWIRILIYSK